MVAPDGTERRKQEPRERLRFWEIMAIGAYLLGFVAIGVYAIAECSLRVFGILWIVGTAAWLIGTVLGFLFGVPRVRAGEPSTESSSTQTSIVPNTNLEQISDWLTKIIVGATLVQLGPLANAIGVLSYKIGSGFSKESGAAVSGGVIVLYFSAGFIWGYLWCSLRVFREMQALVQRERLVRSSETGGSAA